MSICDALLLITGMLTIHLHFRGESKFVEIKMELEWLVL